jgi:hypothetical protein
MKSSAFWNITPFSPMKVNRYFGGTYRLNLQGRKVRNQHEEGSSQKLHAIIFFGLLFSPEDGGDMFLQNVGLLFPDYRALYPTRQNSL